LRAFLNTIAPPLQQVQQAVAPPPQIPSNLSSVLSSLMKNGVPSLPQATLDNLQQFQALQPIRAEAGALQKYEKLILNIRLKPTSAEISK
jgi:hypothetical protein